jgi:hypothetical protein
MLAERRRHIHLGLGMVHAVEAPSEGGLVHRDVRGVGDEVEREEAHDQLRPHRKRQDPMRLRERGDVRRDERQREVHRDDGHGQSDVRKHAAKATGPETHQRNDRLERPEERADEDEQCQSCHVSRSAVARVGGGGEPPLTAPPYQSGGSHPFHPARATALREYSSC